MHALCAGFETSQVKKIDKFYCKSCQLTHGPSTMKRSSGRAHTAIDYNALHNGSAIPLRNPEDARLHPYIGIIRDKTYPFAEENFQRVRPEFVTAENLNNMPGGWNEPFVVPANENLRPWHQEDTDPGSPMSIPSPVELAGSKVLPPPPETDSKGDILPKDEMDGINRRCGLDMMIPKGLTVRKVGEAVGMDRPVEVFNVLTQQSTERWKMNDLVHYFENPAREVIYNCISCEVTNTPLGPQISRPRAVRDTDLVDRVWRHIPYIARPTVGKYVLMSVKDSFTDFHIDFAGSSVFYHVYEGEKVFLLIEPTEKALKAYEAWNLDPHMSAKFFPESIPEIPCRILTLHKGDTMFIPSGWIHAVYTPTDSLVIGGNFLTKNHFANQMKVHHIEVVTGVPPNMKYPRYTTLMWFQALYYMENDPLPEVVDSLIIDGQYADLAAATAKEKEQSSVTYTPEEIQGLPYLVKFLHRNVMITLGVVTTGQGPGTPKLTQKTVDAVKRAAPDPVNKDHLGHLKRFARWCTWKRVVSSTAPDERIPEWAQPCWTPPEKMKVEVTKKPSKFDAKPASDAPRRNGLRERERRGTSISSEQDQAQPVAIPATPAAKTAGSNTTASAKRKAEQETNPAPTSGKKPKTSKASRSTSHGNRNAEIPIMLEEGEQRVILSDGSIYVRKNSNLGPPRAGCQNCRLKKTGCKHKEEIAEILKGTWTAARAAHQAQVEAMEKEKSEKKGKEKAGGKAKEGGEEMVLDEFAIASSSSDDEPLSSPPPPPSKAEKRRAASSTKKAEPVVQQETKPASTESAPSTAPIPPEAPATVVNGTGPPAGFKGRKPSCNECKALKASFLSLL
ncbi:hypothetical protein EX30DRAFT_309793 [Ascodesmis nigricans]|uniref:[histone H3]-dimethyl-L-lysine(36) demethylase n=1 Tax=Ascodesmis nigricans TaxID=341454 RepID=A0A4S2MNT9_9PEZI|nr:hypothetical protein EX30DRAFT_309793 [Ascodesmis nigricans]